MSLSQVFKVIDIKEDEEIKSFFSDFNEGFGPLKEDISKNGLRVPLIVTDDGVLVCGYQRLEALHELGISEARCEVRTFKNRNELIEFAIKENLMRRHLSTEQRYIVYARLSKFYERGKGINFKEYPRDAHGSTISPVGVTSTPTGDVLEETAKQVGESPATIKTARKYAIIIEEHPDLKKMPATSAIWIAKKRKYASERMLKSAGKVFNNLICGDAFEILQNMKPLSVDLVVLDPPYQVREYPNLTENAKSSVISGDLDWGALFKLVYAVLKPNSDIALFGHVKTIIRIHEAIENAGFRDVMDLVWIKPSTVNFLESRVKPLSSHELITLWKKGNFKYNWEGAQGEGTPYNMTRKSIAASFYNVEKIVMGSGGERYMRDVLCFPNKPAMKLDERTEHPTQKPIALLEKLVSALSYEGEVVLDPFAGSGSTLVACERLKRSWIGVEIDPLWIELIKSRVANANTEREVSESKDVPIHLHKLTPYSDTL